MNNEILLNTIVNNLNNPIIVINELKKIVFINISASSLINIKDLLLKLNTKKEKIKIKDKYFKINKYKIDSNKQKLLLLIFQDITTQKILNDKINKIQSSKIMYETIIEKVQDAISVVDKNLKYKYVNDAYLELSGHTKEELINKSISSYILNDNESIHIKAIKERTSVTKIRHNFGNNKDIIIGQASPIIVNGELEGSVAILHSIEKVKFFNEELEKSSEIFDNLNIGKAKYNFSNIIGESVKIKSAKNKAIKASKTPATIFLRGESGTGKELFAHAIHNKSTRKTKKFVSINCAAIPKDLLESILFGYKEGAFTGAKSGGQTGVFEHCKGGTVFLDEIGEISVDIQVKLLRALQEREIVKVGDNKPIKIDIRIISATNANIEKLVIDKKFREDLYYRLNVYPIIIPPLRERRQDIPSIALNIAKKYNYKYNRNIKKIDDSAVKILMNYSWPGNIRELENIIIRSMINIEDNCATLTKEHLPELSNPFINLKNNCFDFVYNGETYKELFEKWEKNTIEKAILYNNGNRAKTAESLNISIRNLYNKMNAYDLKL